jgi:hypothetical protein
MPLLFNSSMQSFYWNVQKTWLRGAKSSAGGLECRVSVRLLN